MSLRFNSEQKSPKRRFLLILGITSIICLLAIGMGLAIMFVDSVWDKFNLSANYRYLIGGVFIIYGILRFSRVFKKDDTE
jgi:uncharacterized membrane protein YqjE